MKLYFAFFALALVACNTTITSPNNVPPEWGKAVVTYEKHDNTGLLLSSVAVDIDSVILHDSIPGIDEHAAYSVYVFGHKSGVVNARIVLSLHFLGDTVGTYPAVYYAGGTAKQGDCETNVSGNLLTYNSIDSGHVVVTGTNPFTVDGTLYGFFACQVIKFSLRQ